MSPILPALGLLSMLVVALFTWAAARGGARPRLAILEAWVNVCIGFGINWLANFAILPLIGAHVDGAANFWMGWIYTVVSVLRQYAIRRWFAERLHRLLTLGF